MTLTGRLARSIEVARVRRQVVKYAAGVVPVAFLNDSANALRDIAATWRLTLATSMLRASRPVNVIATDLGFASTSSLSKAFRQQFGVSPRAWLASADTIPKS